MDNENKDELENLLNEMESDPLPVDITKIEVPIVEEPEPTAVVPAVPTPVVPTPAPEQIDAAKLIKQYLTVYEKFLTNYDTDRAQIERTIHHLEDIVFNVSGAQRVHIEMLVAALRTKAETGGNIVKAMDSLAKILAAAKGTQVLISNTNNNIQQDLDEILKKPLYPDEKIAGK